MAEYAIDYPFALAPYMAFSVPHMAFAETKAIKPLAAWLAKLWQPREQIQTYALLQRLNLRVNETLSYQVREEPGVQSAVETLSCGTGSCRDYAYLFIEAARRLGLAARFVSGYLNTPTSGVDFGATHAWAEVYLPGMGWKGFDPTII